MFTIQQEKLAQVVDILNEKQIDAWMTFVRETEHNADPALPLILGFNVTWQSAFIVSRTGEKIAIVGRYDVENVQRMGGYDEVISYDANIQPALLTILEKLNPMQIAVNYSESDSSADGLSHGMYLSLKRYLKDTPYQLVSAAGILSALRGRKTSQEVERIRKAIQLTEQIIDEVTGLLRPGLTEAQIANYIHTEFRRHDVPPAWEWQYCPIVNCGPDSQMGHTAPSENLVAASGQVVHIDLGVVLDDYVSDIQRVWYLQPADQKSTPTPVQDAFDAVRSAIEAAAAVLKPGVQGWQVDEVARRRIVEAGYPEYQHALGHHIGRTVHDGSTLLGPRWERYGTMPDGTVETGNIFTLELGVHVPGYGIVSLEEDVLVTDDGLEWLTTPQTKLIVVPCP